jgi:Tfp pilus assembly protein PilV
MSVQISKGERGIALIIVLFALLLLSVIGLGMMYSTNLETAINSNYRDKQTAFYAAMAGLQEARQRIVYPYTINPSDNTVTPPLQLPSTTAQNIVYFVANATTVQPWNTSNSYFDTELCQEQVLGLSGTLGMPCTATASGSGWYQAFDDSLSTSSPWNLTHPLDLKWVRIQLKTNNSTPYPVNGNSMNGSQVCWNGVNQISTPSTYTTGCQPIGGVTAVTMITSGSGYTIAPTISFTGGAGSGATATANITHETSGDVVSIAVTTGGIGYTSAPLVTITGLGSGATATAVLSSIGNTTTTGGIVQSVTLTTGGTG